MPIRTQLVVDRLVEPIYVVRFLGVLENTRYAKSAKVNQLTSMQQKNESWGESFWNEPYADVKHLFEQDPVRRFEKSSAVPSDT